MIVIFKIQNIERIELYRRIWLAQMGSDSHRHSRMDNRVLLHMERREIVGKSCLRHCSISILCPHHNAHSWRNSRRLVPRSPVLFRT